MSGQTPNISIITDVTKPIPIEFLNGTKDHVSIKRLSARELYKWIELLNEDSFAMVALSTGKDEAWVDTLDPQSFAEISTAALHVNFTKAAQLAKGDPKFAAKLISAFGALQKLGKDAEQFEEMLKKLLPKGSNGATESSAPSETPSSSVSAEETGTAALTTPLPGSTS